MSDITKDVRCALSEFESLLTPKLNDLGFLCTFSHTLLNIGLALQNVSFLQDLTIVKTHTFVAWHTTL